MSNILEELGTIVGKYFPIAEAAKDRIIRLQSNCDNAAVEIADLRAELAASQAQVAELQAQEGRLLTQITELRRELAAKQAIPAPAPVADTERIIKAARKVVAYRHSMSYNEGYFGEPAGLFKERIAELDRALPPIEIKSAPVAMEISDERLIALRKATFPLPVGKPNVEYGRALRFARAVIAEMSKPAPVAQEPKL